MQYKPETLKGEVKRGGVTIDYSQPIDIPTLKQATTQAFIDFKNETIRRMRLIEGNQEYLRRKMIRLEAKLSGQKISENEVIKQDKEIVDEIVNKVETKEKAGE